MLKISRTNTRSKVRNRANASNYIVLPCRELQKEHVEVSPSSGWALRYSGHHRVSDPSQIDMREGRCFWLYGIDTSWKTVSSLLNASYLQIPVLWPNTQQMLSMHILPSTGFPLQMLFFSPSNDNSSGTSNERLSLRVSKRN